MTDDTFERYRRLILAMKKKGLAANSAEALRKLYRIQAQKGLTQVELLDKLGF